MSTNICYLKLTHCRTHIVAAVSVTVAYTLSGLTSCSNESEKRSDTGSSGVRYSFFVAGHVYGKTSNRYKADEKYDGRLHPPFREHFSLIRSNPRIEFGVFSGDIVKNATSENWDQVDRDVSELGVPVHFAVGNHDVSDRDLYESRYGRTYYSFNHGSDLFVALDPNLDHWNISGLQLSFLREVLADLDSVTNLFVICHQLLWWDSTNRFAEVKPNSTDNRADSVNFWSTVEPILRGVNHPVYLFSGDIGAHPSWRSCMYYQYENITLIASGMGGGTEDNFVITNIMDDGSVTFELVALNGDDVGALGKLEDHPPSEDIFDLVRDFWTRLWTTSS